MLLLSSTFVHHGMQEITVLIEIFIQNHLSCTLRVIISALSISRWFSRLPVISITFDARNCHFLLFYSWKYTIGWQSLIDWKLIRCIRWNVSYWSTKKCWCRARRLFDFQFSSLFWNVGNNNSSWRIEMCLSWRIWFMQIECSKRRRCRRSIRFN